ncbi:MAG: undecaprenyl-phosphate galactose phosphotransferase WbaP [Acidobacteriota bacterium]|nr:undecaprenyl-phosphate galactose phosphotransferase WbaP [Acidobacteriota bacterium]
MTQAATLLRKMACLAVIVTGDILALFVSFIAGFFLRDRVLTALPAFDFEAVPLGVQLQMGFFKGAVFLVVIFAFEKLYTRRLSFWDETRRLIEGATLAFILIMTTVFIFQTYAKFSRTVIILAWLLSLGLFPITRLLVKKILARSGLWRKNVVILGTGRSAQRVAGEILKNEILGYKIAGFLSEAGGNIDEKLSGDLPVLGHIDDFEIIVREYDVKDAVIALSNNRQNELLQVVKACEPFVETIKIVPSIGNVFTAGVRIDELGDVLALSVPRNLAKPWNTAGKRTFEHLICLALLILLAPLWLVIVAALKIDSRGPVIFSQKRLGRGRKEFKIYKFRSMYLDGDARLERYLRDNPEARAEWETFQKLRGDDPRVTRIGKILRTWSLDEMPQILNVLKGDMSLVGPRPYLPRELRKLGPMAAIICQVKPGLTGLWQVRGRNTLTFEERMALDEFYVRNWSLWLDVVILFQTVRAILRREGAF